MGRIDRGWQGRPDARGGARALPSTYQRRLYYDTVVGSEQALRFLLDQVGADRVVLGSDSPFVRGIPRRSPGCRASTLTQDEKDKILWRNLESLLKLAT